MAGGKHSGASVNLSVLSKNVHSQHRTFEDGVRGYLHHDNEVIKLVGHDLGPPIFDFRLLGVLEFLLSLPSPETF
jgi:hypothetical protein